MAQRLPTVRRARLSPEVMAHMAAVDEIRRAGEAERAAERQEHAFQQDVEAWDRLMADERAERLALQQAQALRTWIEQETGG
jgi:hypothetical protein